MRGDGKNLLTLEGNALAAHTLQVFGSARGPDAEPGDEPESVESDPTALIPVSSTVKTLVDVVLARSADRSVPKRLTNRISYTFASSPAGAIIGSSIVNAPVLRTQRRRPTPIASPLRGSGWFVSNGCCADPATSHRADLLAANGDYVTPEIFAIDWFRVVNGFVFHGDGTSSATGPAMEPRSTPSLMAPLSRPSTTASSSCRSRP